MSQAGAHSECGRLEHSRAELIEEAMASRVLQFRAQLRAEYFERTPRDATFGLRMSSLTGSHPAHWRLAIGSLAIGYSLAEAPRAVRASGEL